MHGGGEGDADRRVHGRKCDDDAASKMQVGGRDWFVENWEISLEEGARGEYVS